MNATTRLLLCGAMVSAMISQSGSANAQRADAAAGENKVTAIDILLDPDATMVQRATAANAELLKNSQGLHVGRRTRATCLGTSAVCLHSGLG